MINIGFDRCQLSVDSKGERSMGVSALKKNPPLPGYPVGRGGKMVVLYKFTDTTTYGRRSGLTTALQPRSKYSPAELPLRHFPDKN